MGDADDDNMETYTWDDCINDLALETPLTLRQTSWIVDRLKTSGIHPYDALPSLKLLYSGDDVRNHTHGLEHLLRHSREVGLRDCM